MSILRHIWTTREVKQWSMHPYRGENELGAPITLADDEQIIYEHTRDGGGVPVKTIIIARLQEPTE